MMMWSLLVVIWLCSILYITANTDCLESTGTILLLQDEIRSEKLDHKMTQLDRPYSAQAHMCYCVLTIFFDYVRVEFLSSNWKRAILYAHEKSLTAITSIDYTRSDYTQTQLIYACDFDWYCNRQYYFNLISGELFWLFKQNYTELRTILKPVVYQINNNSNAQLLCSQQNQINSSSCQINNCFARQINQIKNTTLMTCGIPSSYTIDPDVDNEKVKVNLETRLCSDQMRYSQFYYTCNINNCNNEDTIERLNEIIVQHYNMSQLQSHINYTSSTYCEIDPKTTTTTTTTTISRSRTSTTSTTKKTTKKRTSTQSTTKERISITSPAKSTTEERESTSTTERAILSTTVENSAVICSTRFIVFLCFMILILYN